MKNDAGINAQGYWDRRFQQDWESLAGPQQSRFFAVLALEHLPRWIFEVARREDLTVADWGCAQGDGTEVLASCLNPGSVTGIDFSATAIAQARDRHPAVKFETVDWLVQEGGAGYDIVFSSNTLEHFHDALGVLDRIAARATKAVLLALPYRELDRHEEHFFSFLPQNIPVVLKNGFRLAWSRAIDCRELPETSWPGDQIFLVYLNPAWADAALRLALADYRIESVPDGASAREKAAHKELLQLQEELGAVKGALSAREFEMAAIHAELERELERVQHLSAVIEQSAKAGASSNAEQRDAEIRAELERQLERVQRLSVAIEQSAKASVSSIAEQKDAEIRRLQAEIEELRRQGVTLRAEHDARAADLIRISDWAAEIARHPGIYAIKRSSYLLVREIYRQLPLGVAGRQKLKNLAGRITRRGQPAANSSAAVVPLALEPGRRIVPHEGERDVFMFAVIDWHFRIQRPQHLARCLAATGRRVFFFSNVFVDAEEPGYQLERLDPRLDLFQVKLHVKGAPAIYFATALAETVQMLQASIARVIADFGALSSVSVVQHAFWYPLVTTLPNSLRVYDCMDHHEGFGNVPEELVRTEHEMLRGSDLVVVTSSWLENFASSYNRSLVVVRNAVEYDFFRVRPEAVYRDPEGRRIIGYFGAIAEWFDLALVRRIAQAHPDCLVLLVGSDTVQAARQLKDMRNVHFTGEVPYRELPFYLYAFDVCLLPFQVTPLTLATNPVKVYEYLAAGKPVVCVDLPEVGQFGDFVFRAPDHEAFVRCVGQALAQEQSDALVEARQGFAAQQTWAHRGEQLCQALAGLALPKVSVIVLTFNNLQLTKDCLASLLHETGYPNLEIIVVDNASTDGSRDYLQAFAAAHPRVQLILNDENLGFAAGNNVGLAAATGDYLVVLNNDTVVTRGWVLTLLRHLQKDPGIGLIGPVTNNIGNGARVPITYGALIDMPSEAFQLTLPRMGAAFPQRTAAFFCVMMHRAVYEACGPICEDYGRGFFEDDDYCRRVEQEGLRVVCAEDVFVHHHLSASFSKVPSAERQALFDQNRQKYEARWGAWQPHTYSREYRPDVVDTDRLPPAGDGRRKFIVGHCCVCGQRTRFFYTDRALWREMLTCEGCLCTSRYRSLARGLLRAVRELADVEADSLATLPKNGITRRLRVYDTQPSFYWTPCAYPLPDLLKRAGWIDVALSQYKPELAPGAEIGPGITNQNLEQLTYKSGSLDVLITSDVMEHVRLDDQAHREIHRVLRTGGAYIFTVPHNMDWSDTLVRVRVHDPRDAAHDELLMEPEYHGDTNGDGSGVLSYRVYGRDLVRRLEEIGFEVHYTKADLPHEGVLNTELFYCRKVR